MLDPKLLRNDLEGTAEALTRRGYQIDTARFAALEERRKALQVQADEVRSYARAGLVNEAEQALSRLGAAGELLAHGTSTLMALPGKGIHLGVKKFIEDKGEVSP